MCGISGIIYKSNKGDFSELLKMQTHLMHRGPDSFGNWFSDDGRVGLSHNRLSIVDLTATGSQPMQNERFVLVYNGEIYNHQEIRNKIPTEWKGTSDTETLLQAITVWGLERTLNEIEGMYAFALWDKLDKKLYLQTDLLGIKPLYVYEDEYLFAFASNPGALTHLKSEWQLNVRALVDYLALGSTGKHSLFAGITKYESKRTLKEVKTTEADLISEVKKSIQSVKMADVPVFMFLSGGIDSTMVASQCEGLTAVHLASPEEQFARQVAEKYNNPFIKVDPLPHSAQKCLEDYAFKSGDCSMAALTPYIVSAEVRKYGKVAISANGADELFFGYDRMNRYQSINQLHHIFRREIHALSGWEPENIHEDSRHMELDTYIRYDLNKTLDFASMCHGLEVRVPYLNRKVVEKALGLSREKHVNGMGNKSILKKYLESEGFGMQFLNRPKVGFSMHYEPKDYENLKKDGKKLLKEVFNIDPVFTGRFAPRDERYYEASAASFFCWWNVWKEKVKA